MRYRQEQMYGWGEGMNWEVGTDTYTLLCLKQMANEDRLCSTRTTTQCSAVT